MSNHRHEHETELEGKEEIGGRVSQSHLGEASVKENFPHELKFVAFILKTYKHVKMLLVEPSILLFPKP